MDTAVPARPVSRWHGGKWRLAPWIISHLPPHRVYVEPYCEAAKARKLERLEGLLSSEEVES